MRHLFVILAMLAVDWTILDARITRGLSEDGGATASVDGAALMRKLNWLVLEPVRRIGLGDCRDCQRRSS